MSRLFKVLKQEYKEHKIISNLLKIYKKTIIKYKNKSDTPGNIPNNIFIFWYQEIENAPILVKKCIDSVLNNSAGFKVNIITKNNLNDYIKIDKRIMNKLNNKIISLAAFSDILRFNLLNKYGGIWVDATIFVTNNVFDDFSKKSVNSIKLSYKENFEYISRGKWTSFFFGSKKGSVLTNFMSEVLNDYYIKFDTPLDYFLIDYFLYIAYKKIKCVRKQINSLEPFNLNIYALSKMLNEEYNEEKYSKLVTNTFVHKLSYKIDCLEKLPTGERTVYSFITNDSCN